ncbi:P-loop containing nucleoside triphosphate hydrolase protein [Aspergillus multicolor]|uniref:P-loop containing nucleoside triphosphate hydrolase protein n=1 Tax=Aspergillus multicolor TaxID=41759 RepID=UPI003CCCDF29
MSRHQVPRPPPFSKPEVHLKIVTIGNTFCGKTCLLTAFVQGTMPKAYIPTTFDVHTANMMLDGKHVELILPGTAHYGSFASYRPESYSKPHVVLICFEIGEAPGCLAGLKGWIREAHEFARGLPIILVGCKQDLRDSPKGGNLISEVEWLNDWFLQAEAVAGEIGASRYLECSARTGKGVLEVFEVAARVALMPKQTGWWRRIPGLR